jgi:ABC-type phosphate/phosphonate transport system ATPase subunit
VDQARLNLQYATIRAPISGRTGSLRVREGNLVRSTDSNPLVTINQIQPILVRFAVPAANLGAIQRYRANQVAVIASPTGGNSTSKGTLAFVEGVHPRFDRKRAEEFLARTDIRPDRRVRQLSKGMVTQLHLALILAIDARLLVLDEPTLGLDILYRKQFYDSLLNDYFDRSRTIVVTTHQVEEIQHVLTDVMFIDRGRIVFNCTMDELESRYLELMVHPERVAAARALKPIHERQLFDRTILVFDAVDRRQLDALGDVRTPSIADLFVAVMGKKVASDQ